MTEEQKDDPFSQGELIAPTMSFRPVGTPQTFDAGTFLNPVKIHGSTAEEFSALHLALSDLKFARDCFVEADQLGPPNSGNTTSKALIFAGVVAYARPFATGVRLKRLDGAYFDGSPGFFQGTHEYLMSLRSKHVAHPVNAFERCETVGIIAALPGQKWRYAGCIGTVEQQSIGLNQKMLRMAIGCLNSMIEFLSGKIEEKRAEVDAEFSAQFGTGKTWHTAPIVSLVDRVKVGKSRPR